MAFDEKQERQDFEEWAFDEYRNSCAEALVKFPNVRQEAPMDRARFLKPDDEMPGHYAVIGLDAAWHGWKSRAKLAAPKEAALLELRVLRDPILEYEGNLRAGKISGEDRLTVPHCCINFAKLARIVELLKGAS